MFFDKKAHFHKGQFFSVLPLYIERLLLQKLGSVGLKRLLSALLE